jgi:lipopolysaccharide export system protein LptC
VSAAARWSWRIRDALSAYLPLLLMALLALATWWLVNNTPVPGDVPRKPPVRHEPDYTMSEFTLQRFAEDGSLRVQIDGDTLRHYPDTDMIEIDDVRVRAISADGRLTVASARRATVNGEATEVRLLGGAEVRAESRPPAPPVEMKSEFLHAFLDTERVRTHLPVWVQRGTTEVRADGLDYDHREELLQFKGNVRATIEPRPKTP